MGKKELMELRGQKLAALKQLNDAIGDAVETAEQTAELTKLNAEIDGIDAQIVALDDANARAVARAKKIEELSAKSFSVNTGARPGGNRNTSGKMSNDEVCAFSATVLNTWADPRNADAEVIGDVKAFGFDPFGKELRLNIAPTRAVNKGINGVKEFAAGISQISTGGALIMPMFISELETALLAYGGIRQHATVIRTGKSTEIPYPTLNSTSQTATIVGEGGSVSAASISFGQVKVGAHKYTPGHFPVSRELLRDSEFDMGAILGAVMGESIGRGQAAHFISGTGASQPMGILTASTSGATSAAATAITIADLRNLIKSLDPAYRPQASFLMHDNTVVALSELTGGDGQYLWKRDVTGAAPSNFDGYPIRIDNSLASSITASSKPVVFGVLNKYLIRDVNTIRMQRLTELYALSDQDSFVAFMETDANLLNAGTNPVKYLTQHS